MVGRAVVKVLFAGFFSVFLLWGTPSWADLSPSGAFTLIKRVPPGESVDRVTDFLGKPLSDRLLNDEGTMKIRRWEVAGKWFLDVLHDGKQVRAARVTWLTPARGEQSRIFAGLTGAGREQFGRSAVFSGRNEARWSQLEGRWIVVAALEEKGVTLLSAIRDKIKDSSKYGF